MTTISVHRLVASVLLFFCLQRDEVSHDPACMDDHASECRTLEAEANDVAPLLKEAMIHSAKPAATFSRFEFNRQDATVSLSKPPRPWSAFGHTEVRRDDGKFTHIISVAVIDDLEESLSANFRGADLGGLIGIDRLPGSVLRLQVIKWVKLKGDVWLVMQVYHYFDGRFIRVSLTVIDDPAKRSSVAEQIAAFSASYGSYLNVLEQVLRLAAGT